MIKSARLKLPALLSVMTLLLGCVTTQTQTIVTDTTCDTQCQVQYSLSKDTPETIAQVRENNAAYGAICPPKKCTWSEKSVDGIRCLQGAGKDPDKIALCSAKTQGPASP